MSIEKTEKNITTKKNEKTENFMDEKSGGKKMNIEKNEKLVCYSDITTMDKNGYTYNEHIVNFTPYFNGLYKNIQEKYKVKPLSSTFFDSKESYQNYIDSVKLLNEKLYYYDKTESQKAINAITSTLKLLGIDKKYSKEVYKNLVTSRITSNSIDYTTVAGKAIKCIVNAKNAITMKNTMEYNKNISNAILYIAQIEKDLKIQCIPEGESLLTYSSGFLGDEIFNEKGEKIKPEKIATTLDLEKIISLLDKIEFTLRNESNAYTINKTAMLTAGTFRLHFEIAIASAINDFDFRESQENYQEKIHNNATWKKYIERANAINKYYNKTVINIEKYLNANDIYKALTQLKEKVKTEYAKMNKEKEDKTAKNKIDNAVKNGKIA